MLPFIHTAETFYGPGAEIPCRAFERAYLLHLPRVLPLIREQLHRRGELAGDVETAAWIENGAWIAQCPFCLSAQVVTPDDPYYLCAGAGGCSNLAVHGAHISVVFPGSRERKKLERTLLKRPMMHNRNWLAHETHEQLVAENLLHGAETA